MVGKRIKSHVVEKMVFSVMLVILAAALFIFVGALRDINITNSYLDDFDVNEISIKELKSDLGELSKLPSCQTDYMSSEFDRIYEGLELKEDMVAIYTMQLVTMRDVNIAKLTMIELVMLTLIAILSLTIIMVRVYEKVQ